MILKLFLLIKKNYKLVVLVKQLSPDPFEHIENYELNKVYKVKVVKIMDFGAFCELEAGLIYIACIRVNLSWNQRKTLSAKKMFKVNDEIDCVSLLR